METYIKWINFRVQFAWFHIRAIRLRLLRTIQNVTNHLFLLNCQAVKIVKVDDLSDWPIVVGESITPLWSSIPNDDWMLVAGKIQNLRVAAHCINGLRIPSNVEFSFWESVGKPTKHRGFVEGRELREGCMIASVGGGICQLSNALYTAALHAEFEIVERHQHSQIVPGSLAAIGQDATVFWNYVDLRFRSPVPFFIEAVLTQSDLVVRFRLQQPQKQLVVKNSNVTASSIIVKDAGHVDDCLSCEQIQCVQNIKPKKNKKTTAILLDEMWLEFDQWLSTQTTVSNFVYVPINGKYRNKSKYAWSICARDDLYIIEHWWLTVKRSILSRLFSKQGARRQRLLISCDRALAKAYTHEIPYFIDELVVPVSLLSHLSMMGALGGRRVTVLMNRAPLGMIHRDLDRATALHPDSPSLNDFRVDHELVKREENALANADCVVTPHHGVAQYLLNQHHSNVLLLDWIISTPVKNPKHGKRILFPASSLGRKGAYEVKAACIALDLKIYVLGKACEDESFWSGISVFNAPPEKLFDDVGCVLLPAFVEHRPSLLLAAIARDIPVICTAECGLSRDMRGVSILPAGNIDSIIKTLVEFGFGNND